MAQQSLRARASSLSRLHDHTQTHHTQYDSSGRVISPTPRPLPDSTQHSQETDIETTTPASERLQTHSLEGAAHWDRSSSGLHIPKQLSLYNDYLYCYLTRINAKLVNTTIVKTV